ncbi:histidine kinase [Aldersonia sp. NBC_00410]|uniref:sensor histidine kinase n=1 Tax=Aldersonia sp. NBC_00410 TaxID=2975954 RepID=UPI00224D8C6D|nr:histidine kinase [Aldersonia sp. NBC_00410]MCX5042956.1 histidine kinase [Aldersonia sp. NBC_00410]
MKVAAPVSAVTEKALRSRMVPAKAVDYIARRMAEMPHEYTPAVVIVSDVAMVVIAIVAVAQRDGFFPPGVALLGGLITILPLVAMLFRKDFIPTRGQMFFRLSAGAIVGASLILLEPAYADVAPFILVLIVGEIAAMASVRVSLLVAAVAVAALIVPALLGRLEFVPVYITVTALGWLIGFVLQTQLRLLEQERLAQLTRADQAASAERQRISREVHDVVAHSLSVTMLHLTAARRALQEDNDTAEAIDALIDAERLGRQAMSDIRRTVGLLREGPADHAPEPGVGDIGTLIDDFVRAGLPVESAIRGNSKLVPDTVGLCLYRITQESLANVAKHASGARTRITLKMGSTGSTLIIGNDLPRKVFGQQSQGGSGLIGMQQRARLVGGTLTAGRTRDSWQVRADIPYQPENSAAGHTCTFGEWR